MFSLSALEGRGKMLHPFAVKSQNRQVAQMPPPCVSCRQPSKYECSICKTRYCSQSCQSNDWMSHRDICSLPPLKEVKVEEQCALPVSVRDGSTSFVPSPVVIKPSAFVAYERQLDASSSKIPLQPKVLQNHPNLPMATSELDFSPPLIAGTSKIPLKTLNQNQQRFPKVELDLAPPPPGTELPLAPKNRPAPPGFFRPVKKAPPTRMMNNPAAGRGIRKPTVNAPVRDSIVEVLQVGDTVSFLVQIPFQKDRVVGILTRSEVDVPPLHFNARMNQFRPPQTDFHPEVGSMVAALSPALGEAEYYRGYVCNVVKSSSTLTKYSVLYIDYGNVEEGVITVKPVPPGFQYPALAVKLSLCPPFEPSAEEFIQKEMVENSLFNNIKILSDYQDGNVIAQLYDKDGFFLARVKLESWKALIPAPPPVISRPPRPPPPIQRQIRSRPLEPGFCDDVMPFHVEDLDHIYVQLVQLEVVDSCDTIQQTLAEYFPTSTKLSVLPAAGSYVAAYWNEGEGLFRARVKSADITTSTIEAEFIDYGNTARLPLADLRVLPDSLYEYPASVNLVSLGQIPHVKDAPLPPSVLEFITGIVGQVCTMLVLPSSEEGPVQCMLTASGQVLNEIITDMLVPKRIPTSKPLAPRMPLLNRVSNHTLTLEPNANMPPLRDVPIPIPEPVAAQMVPLQEAVKLNPTTEPVLAQMPPLREVPKHISTPEPAAQMPLLREVPQPILSPKPVAQSASFQEAHNLNPEPVVAQTHPRREVPEPISIKEPAAQMPSVRDVIKRIRSPEPASQMPSLREVPMRPPVPVKPVVAAQMPPLREVPKPTESSIPSLPEPAAQKQSIREVLKRMRTPEPEAQMLSPREVPKQIPVAVRSLPETAAQMPLLREVSNYIPTPEPAAKPLLREIPKQIPVAVQSVPEPASQMPLLREVSNCIPTPELAAQTLLRGVPKQTPALARSLPEPAAQMPSLRKVPNCILTPEPAAQSMLREVPKPIPVPVQSLPESTVKMPLLNETSIHIPTPQPVIPAQMPSVQEACPDPPPTPVDNTLGQFSYEDGPFLELPKEGVTFKALILSADSPQTIMLCPMEDESLFSKMEELDELLAAYKGGPSFGHTPKVGEVCLVLSPLLVEDEEEKGKLVWYRAACLCIIESDSYLCILVDYGRIVAVDSNCIRRIPKRLVHFLPFVAQQAVLLGLEEGDVTEELVQRFKQLVPDGCQIEARVCKKVDERYVIELPSIASILLQEGLLKWN